MLNRPPTVLEIFVTLNATYGRTVNNIYEAVAILFSLLREDLIYADQHCYRYTIHKQEGFFSYSESFRKQFPVGYGCDKAGRVIPITARRINLNELRQVLISRD